ncbi:MAG: hypothetical protein ACI9WU_003866 [Myxococcota bacterium]|jgi:hypothetical protein
MSAQVAFGAESEATLIPWLYHSVQVGAAPECATRQPASPSESRESPPAAASCRLRPKACEWCGSIRAARRSARPSGPRTRWAWPYQLYDAGSKARSRWRPCEEGRGAATLLRSHSLFRSTLLSQLDTGRDCARPAGPRADSPRTHPEGIPPGHPGLPLRRSAPDYRGDQPPRHHRGHRSRHHHDPPATRTRATPQKPRVLAFPWLLFYLHCK